MNALDQWYTTHWTDELEDKRGQIVETHDNGVRYLLQRTGPTTRKLVGLAPAIQPKQPKQRSKSSRQREIDERYV